MSEFCHNVHPRDHDGSLPKKHEILEVGPCLENGRRGAATRIRGWRGIHSNHCGWSVVLLYNRMVTSRGDDAAHEQPITPSHHRTEPDRIIGIRGGRMRGQRPTGRDAHKIGHFSYQWNCQDGQNQNVRQHEPVTECVLRAKFHVCIFEQSANHLSADIDDSDHDTYRDVITLYGGGHPSTALAASPNAPAVGCTPVDDQSGSPGADWRHPVKRSSTSLNDRPRHRTSHCEPHYALWGKRG